MRTERDSVKYTIVKKGGLCWYEKNMCLIWSIASALPYGIGKEWISPQNKGSPREWGEMQPQVTVNNRIYCISLSLIQKLLLFFAFSLSERLSFLLVVKTIGLLWFNTPRVALDFILGGTAHFLCHKKNENICNACFWKELRLFKD